MSHWATEQDDVQFSEPILAQKGVRLKVAFAEGTTWKDKTGLNAGDTPAIKLTLDIDDDTVKCEHADAKPKRTIVDQFNIGQHPYLDKKTGEVKKLGKQKLYQVEEAFGFEPVFLVNGKKVEPFVTRTGAKRAPKIDGVKRTMNPEFLTAYFDADGNPNVDNWVGKTIYANVGVEVSEQYGSKNVIDAYVKAPAI